MCFTKNVFTKIRFFKFPYAGRIEPLVDGNYVQAFAIYVNLHGYQINPGGI